MQRMFSKPFVRAMGEHTTSITALCLRRGYQQVFSGSIDGSLKLHDYTNGMQLFSIQAHSSIIKGIASPSQTMLLTAGRDNFLNFYNLENERVNVAFKQNLGFPANSMSCSMYNNFAVATAVDLQIFDVQRYDPIIRDEKTVFQMIQYSRHDNNLILGLYDNLLKIYDARIHAPSMSMELLSHACCVSNNPVFPWLFAVGCDDGYCYTFDIRAPSQALDRYGGMFTPSVSCDFAPNGRELVVGCEKGTVQIYNIRTVAKQEALHDNINMAINKDLETARAVPNMFKVNYRDMYHNKRQGGVDAVLFTEDNHYILSGSREGNIRVWKTIADATEKSQSRREREAKALRHGLIRKFQNVPAVQQVLKSGHLPKKLKSHRKQQVMKEQAYIRKTERAGSRVKFLKEQVRKDD